MPNQKQLKQRKFEDWKNKDSLSLDVFDALQSFLFLEK